eukprot:9891827-Heterocapsa_arctica.AAC.1
MQMIAVRAVYSEMKSAVLASAAKSPMKASELDISGRPGGPAWRRCPESLPGGVARRLARRLCPEALPGALPRGFARRAPAVKLG